MDISRAIYLELYAEFRDLFKTKHCDSTITAKIRLEDSPKIVWKARFQSGINMGKFVITVDFCGKRSDMNHLYFYNLYLAFHKPIENQIAEGLLDNEHKLNQQKNAVKLFPAKKEIDNTSLCKVLKFLGHMPKDAIITATDDQAEEYLVVFFNREVKKKYASNNQSPIISEIDRSRYVEYVSKYDYKGFQGIAPDNNYSINDLDYQIENFFLTIGSNASIQDLMQLWGNLTEWYRDFAFQGFEDFIKRRGDFYPTETITIVDRTDFKNGTQIVLVHVTELIPIIRSSSFGSMKTETIEDDDIVRKKRGRIFEIKALPVNGDWLFDGIKERFSYLI